MKMECVRIGLMAESCHGFEPPLSQVVVLLLFCKIAAGPSPAEARAANQRVSFSNLSRRGRKILHLSLYSYSTDLAPN
jgi:hypothetical protein